MKRHNLNIEHAWLNWNMCLKGKDKNSIFNQITFMLWDTAIFRIILESQKDKIDKDSQTPRINKQLYTFIYRNYFHAQSAYIRRITDPNSCLAGKFGTYSLGAIIKHLKEYRMKLTRKKYIELIGLPYNYSDIREKELAFLLNHSPRQTILIPEELDWWKIKDAHDTFDRLSQINIENREPTDLISEDLLDRLIRKLDECKKINEYVNKFIAHSSTIESRSMMNIEEFNITLGDIWHAHKIIFQLSNFLSAQLFSVDNMPLAIEHPSFFAHWDEPFYDKEEAIDKVRTTLDAYREETETWMESSIKDVWSWIES